jgi:hypothetical protein
VIKTSWLGADHCRQSDRPGVKAVTLNNDEQAQTLAAAELMFTKLIMPVLSWQM